MTLAHTEMVLLDVDGTLVDTVPDLAYSIDAMLQETMGAVDNDTIRIEEVRLGPGR